MWYYPGDVVSVRVNGFIKHEGIMTESGRVISNSRRRGGVYEESVRTFAAGGRLINHGALNRTDPDIVLARARARASRRYDPYRYNCEHFVRECYGLAAHSPQKRLAMGAAAILALIAII